MSESDYHTLDLIQGDLVRVAKHVSKALAAVISAGNDILKNRFAPCQVQRVELHGKGLFIGRDAGRNIFIPLSLRI